MTENLYETNQFTNHTNGTYLFQHSPSTLGAPHYGVPNINSIQSSPMSPRLNHEQLTSPGTPGHELSPMLEMPNSGGTWNIISLEGHHHGDLLLTKNYPRRLESIRLTSRVRTTHQWPAKTTAVFLILKAWTRSQRPSLQKTLNFSLAIATGQMISTQKITFQGFCTCLRVSQKDQTGNLWSLQFLTQWSFKVNAIRPASIHQKAKTQCTTFTKTINSFTMDTSNTNRN